MKAVIAFGPIADQPVNAWHLGGGSAYPEMSDLSFGKRFC